MPFFRQRGVVTPVCCLGKVLKPYALRGKNIYFLEKMTIVTIFTQRYIYRHYRHNCHYVSKVNVIILCSLVRLVSYKILYSLYNFEAETFNLLVKTLAFKSRENC